ncbi:MAG: ABC transporter substrate-binding protein [Actinomycetota bacterium]|nr:ABC transporter substrate-binding protein [Actinomycetota bacterium]
MGSDKSISKFRRVISILTLVLAFFLFLIPGCKNEKQNATIRIGYIENELDQLPYYIAREKGYFEEEGLEIREAEAFNSGAEEMSAFSAGELDMGYVGASSALVFAGREMANVRIVAQVSQDSSALVVKKGLEADDVSSLVGRTIAVPGSSTVQDFVLRLALSKAKVDEKDVGIITLEPTGMLEALSSGEIDAFMAAEPYPSIALSNGSGRILLKSSRISNGIPGCVLVADSDFLSSNLEIVQKVIGVHIKATEFINKNLTEASDMAHLFIGQPRETIEMAMKDIKFSFKPDEDALQRYATFLKECGVISVDNPGAFVKSILETGFLPEEK